MSWKDDVEVRIARTAFYSQCLKVNLFPSILQMKMLNLRRDYLLQIHTIASTGQAVQLSLYH